MGAVVSLPLLAIVHHLRALALPPGLDLVYLRDEGEVRVDMRVGRCLFGYPTALFALRGQPATLEEMDACVAAAIPWMQEQAAQYPHAPLAALEA